MCGIAGLFIGCSALTYCPRQLLSMPAGPEPGEPGEPGTENYRSPFRTWDERAAVRQYPRRLLGPEDETAVYFSPDLVPLTRHSLVRELRPELFDRILTQHLYRYLDFTTKLETLVVNSTVLGIASGSVGIALPEEMRFDAYKIYCDEAYHALFSMDLMRQVVSRTGIRPLLPTEPYFLRRLRQIQEALPSNQRPLAELLFVTISETLISATLADIPADSTVAPAVRDAIRDHAADEGRHHAYFVIFLRHLWGSLDRTGRREAALLAPRLINAFLRPDTDAIRSELISYGLARDDAEQVLAEVYDEKTVLAHTRATAVRTVQYFATLDALELPSVEAEFHRYGLLPGRR
ncbi:diiron oxygenase [Micromonospora sp. NPDC051227]|uniref:diiron oxygenase n=1 Tax=Micromonospora sp. NPDC051227 TaxID=3364285 RepID=UPI001934A755|nr:diiron oxygenase [Micromonospora sp. STR1s_5]